ncbi:hypothetical protein BJX64DRAFT_260243 [Aspergillus heterothallicus]
MIVVPAQHTKLQAPEYIFDNTSVQHYISLHIWDLNAVNSILFRNKNLSLRLMEHILQSLGYVVVTWLVASALNLAGAAPLAAALISKGTTILQPRHPAFSVFFLLTILVLDLLSMANESQI